MNTEDRRLKIAKIERERKYRAIELQNKLLTITAFALLLVFIALLSNATRDYIRVKNCIDKDLTYWEENNCAEVMRID